MLAIGTGFESQIYLWDINDLRDVVRRDLCYWECHTTFIYHIIVHLSTFLRQENFFIKPLALIDSNGLGFCDQSLRD